MKKVVHFLLFFLLACVATCEAQSKPGKSPAQPAKAAQKPDSFTVLLNQADEAIAKADFSTAIAALEKYTAGRPDEAYGFFQLGYAHTGQKNWDLARRSYAKAIALDPKMGAAQLNLGLVVLENGEAKDAIEPLRRAVDLLPDSAQAKFLLGTALEKAGQNEPAATSYRAAIQKDAKEPEYHLSLGRLLLNTLNPGEAQKSFEAALRIRPDAAYARLGLAQALLAQKKWEPAATELERYLLFVPDDMASRLQRAHALLELSAADAALAELDKVETAGKPSRDTQKLRVQAYLQLHRLDAAVLLLEEILAAEPGNIEFHALLGRLYLGQRKFPEAEKSLLAALRLKPDLMDSLRDLASVYYLAENYTAALRAQDLLLKGEAPQPFFWFVRATCFDKLGMQKQALETYEKFVALDQGRTDKQDFQARQRIIILRRELERKK